MAILFSEDEMVRDLMTALAETSASDAKQILGSLKRCAAIARGRGDAETLKIIEQSSLFLDGAIGASQGSFGPPAYTEPCEICGKRTVDPECGICG